MEATQVNLKAARLCLQESNSLINAGKNEQVVRDSFTSHLRQVFTEAPNWILRHIQGSEAAVKIAKNGSSSTGFVDNLVDLTAIEYEGDLRNSSKYRQGHLQVKDYCASLFNAGNDPDLIIGILSDTIRWYAYQIDVSALNGEVCSRENIVLIELEHIDCSGATKKDALDLIRFLVKYLARIGARPVTANSIAKDLGFENRFSRTHVLALSGIISSAFEDNPKYANLISELWCNFVSYLREEGQSDTFDLTTYVDEYYILTLGKLLCANYLENKALNSDDAELSSIINGSFFENRGLLNFVEYDYFGWINATPNIEVILPIARSMQQDLMAYDFRSNPVEDLFGELMAQLANRSQRLLLGQEWTPGWLSQKIVEQVVSSLESAVPIQFIDMCCGSGSMIVETIKIAKERIIANNADLSKEAKLHLLNQCITGFDIDPLAVMLSKINWVLAALDWIAPLGTHQISIPVYHADSLFAITPISNSGNDDQANVYLLKIAEYAIDLPQYLISPEYRSFFDNLIDYCYRLVRSAEGQPSLIIDLSDLTSQVLSIQVEVGVDLDGEQIIEVTEFLNALMEKIDLLSRDGRNGIWSYILRNSFRPGLVLGQFNGLVSNPPWLALSKVAHNPYQTILKKKADNFGIKPPGSSHLHIELATIFLLHAIQQYLVDGAQIGCIVPETLLNGHHHNPFRKMAFSTASSAVAFDIDEIWKVQEHVFKNNAIVLFGVKESPDLSSADPISGKVVYQIIPSKNITFYKNTQGNRTAWSEQAIADDGSGFYNPASFRQGADIMPRSLLFYEVSAGLNINQVAIKSINPTTSPIAFTVKDAKKHQGFSLAPRMVPKEFIFDVVTSNLLTAFDVAPLQKALLPIKKNINNVWEVLSNTAIVGKGPGVANTLSAIAKTIDPLRGDASTIFSLVNVRGKLSQQILPPTGFIVMTGAGGGKVCAGFLDLGQVDAKRLILDQTVYFAYVSTLDETIYLTGLLNSEAINEIIEEFQPRGAFGKRHVHKLPFGVTPPFDSAQAAHQDVVAKTKILIGQYEVIKKGDAEIILDLNPNSSTLSRRRKRIGQRIKTLSAYDEYEAACRALYGL
ncbi:hypothetical protein ACVWYG_002045 [Pedobacter sp. UYEF25]